MDEEQRRQLGARLRDARKQRGWSAKQFGQAAGGIAENTVLSIEAGNRAQEGKIAALCAAAGVDQPLQGERVLSLEGLPDDVIAFLLVAHKRLPLYSDNARSRVLADIYPRMIEADLNLPG